MVFPGAGVEAEVTIFLAQHHSFSEMAHTRYSTCATASARPPQDLLRSSQRHGPVKTFENRAEYRECGIANLGYSM